MFGCYPEIAVDRLMNGHNASVIWITGMELLKFLPVIPEQARFSPHPQKSFGVLEQARYRQVGQPLLLAIVLENKTLGCGAHGQDKAHHRQYRHGASTVGMGSHNSANVMPIYSRQGKHLGS